MDKKQKKTEEKLDKKLEQVSGGLIFPNGKRMDYSTADAATAARMNPQSKFKN